MKKWLSNLSSVMQLLGFVIALSNLPDIFSSHPLPVSVSVRAVAGCLLIFSGQIIAKMLASRGAFSPTLIPLETVAMRLEKFAMRYLGATPELPVRWNATTVKLPAPPDRKP